MAKKLTKIKAILFDIDDTLFDRNIAQSQMLELFKREYVDIFSDIDEHMINTAFLEADRYSTEAFFATGLVDSVRIKRFEIFLAMLGIEQEHARSMLNLYLDNYAKVDAEMEGAKAVLKKLAEKYQLGVISNGLAKAQYQKLDSIGIKNIFESITISEEVGLQKPDPRIFWKAGSGLDRKPEECLYVGNSYNIDILGAIAAGMASCWFNPGGNRPVEQERKPDYEISSLRDILKTIK
ncbi:MAG: HAD family hydrolase [candidate division Zixibacteria bacterium]|nr:HAD family hydrolase [candidate division Zixibacteria bacterium]